MTGKRYFVTCEVGNVICELISRKLSNDEFEHLTYYDIVDRLNQLTAENEQLKEEIARQKFSKKIMRANIKDYERAIKRLRKSYEEFDEMRLDRIRFLEKRLKENGLSIYVNDCGDLE